MTEVKVQQATPAKREGAPVFQEMEELVGRIRQRAFDLFSGRGPGDGRALEDWLAAEREICWPAAELSEEGSRYELSVALPGFKAEDITVTVAPTELVVHAKQQSSTKSRDRKASKLCWSEFQSNDVYRRVGFPQGVDPASASATLGDGLLEVTLQKAAEAPRRVPVASAA